MLKVVRDCVEMPCHNSGNHLGDLIDIVNARIRRRAVVFVLSDFGAKGYEHALELSSRHHDVVAVRLLAREFIDPPRRVLRAMCPSANGATEQVCDFVSKRFREQWLAQNATWREQHDELLGRSRIEGIDVEIPHEPNIKALAQPLLDFFRQRQRREAGR